VRDHRGVDQAGLPMSPLVLLQLVGPAIAQHVTETLHAVFPDRFHISENLRRAVAAGKTAINLAEGGQPKVDPKVDPEVAALYKVGDSPSTAPRVREQALAALAEEARLILDEGVVAEPQDIDLCMITGTGWPFHMGGITPYLDRTGISEEVTGRRFLVPGVASVPAP
jgi:3-hydroxyacyl-CoA dehydrogenase